MTTRWILATALCAALGVACDDGPTTPAEPTPTTDTGSPPAENARAGTAQAQAGNTNPMGSRTTASPETSDGSRHVPGNGPLPTGGENHGSWTDLDVPVMNNRAPVTRTNWLTANPEPVTVGSWTGVDSCSGSNCWKHVGEGNDLRDWRQVSNCATAAPSQDLACWERTPDSNDGRVTIRFSRSGHTTAIIDALGPWIGTYFPNGLQRSIESGAAYGLHNCGSGGVGNTPVECTTTIPADACEAEEIHEEDIPGYGPWRHVLRAICRPAKVVLNTLVGGDPLQAHRNQVCIRTRAFFDGETVTSEANC